MSSIPTQILTDATSPAPVGQRSEVPSPLATDPPAGSSEGAETTRARSLPDITPELQLISVPTPPESRLSTHDHAIGTSGTDPSLSVADLANTMGSTGLAEPSGPQDFRSASGDESRLFPADSADAELQFISVPTPPESRISTYDHAIGTSDTDAAFSVADLANTMGSTDLMEPSGLQDFRSASGDGSRLFPADSADAELQFISVPTPPESRISIHDYAIRTPDTDAAFSVTVTGLANTMGSTEFAEPSGPQDFRSASGDGSRLFPADSADADLHFISVPSPPESRISIHDHAIGIPDTDAAFSVTDLANTMGSTGLAEPSGLQDFRSASGDGSRLFPADSADAELQFISVSNPSRAKTLHP